MLASEAVELSSGWFLENAWLIALIPVVAFAIIIAITAEQFGVQKKWVHYEH